MDTQTRTLPDGRMLTLWPLTFDRWRISVGPDDLYVDDNW